MCVAQHICMMAHLSDGKQQSGCQLPCYVTGTQNCRMLSIAALDKCVAAVLGGKS